MGKKQPTNRESLDAKAKETRKQQQIAQFTVEEYPLKHLTNLPARRGGATLTRVGDDRVYLIGGTNREAISYEDIFELDLVACRWKQITPVEGFLPPRSGHSAIAIEHLIVVFGGLNVRAQVVYNDLHVFDTDRRVWTKIDAVEGDAMPAPRNSHAAILLEDILLHDGLVTYSILLFGGSCPDHGPFDDVFVLHVTLLDDKSNTPVSFRWERIECRGASPEPRELHTATFVGDSQTICFSGGRNIEGGICSDVAILKWHKNAPCEWQTIALATDGDWNRCSHVAGSIWNGISSSWETWSFGGWDGKTGILNDVWEFSFRDRQWVQAQPSTAESNQQQFLPAQRFGHCACVIPLTTGGVPYALQPDQGQDQEEKQKPHRHLANSRRLLVFGGMNVEQDFNDLVLITPSHN